MFQFSVEFQKMLYILILSTKGESVICHSKQFQRIENQDIEIVAGTTSAGQELSYVLKFFKKTSFFEMISGALEYAVKSRAVYVCWLKFPVEPRLLP